MAPERASEPDGEEEQPGQAHARMNTLRQDGEPRHENDEGQNEDRHQVSGGVSGNEVVGRNPSVMGELRYTSFAY